MDAEITNDIAPMSAKRYADADNHLCASRKLGDIDDHGKWEATYDCIHVWRGSLSFWLGFRYIANSDDSIFFGRSDVLAASGGHTSTLAGRLDVQHGGSYKFSIVAVAVMCNSHRRRESVASWGVK